MVDQRALEFLNLLAARLEHLSADSRLARKASGLRGNILKLLEETITDELEYDKRVLSLTNAAFEILRQAAVEIPNLENPNNQDLNNDHP
jgi:hypothetical protein